MRVADLQIFSYSFPSYRYPRSHRASSHRIVQAPTPIFHPKVACILDYDRSYKFTKTLYIRSTHNHQKQKVCYNRNLIFLDILLRLLVLMWKESDWVTWLINSFDQFSGRALVLDGRPVLPQPHESYACFCLPAPLKLEKSRSHTLMWRQLRL